MQRSSILRDHRATPAIVDADGDEIDVLTDALVERHAGRADGSDSAVAHKGMGTILHEHVIVFDAGRPVRRETIFEAHTDHATPTGIVTGRGTHNVGDIAPD